jgi:hypothetical protein
MDTIVKIVFALGSQKRNRYVFVGWMNVKRKKKRRTRTNPGENSGDTTSAAFTTPREVY